MSKLNKIKNGEYIGGDKYIITPESSGKSRVVFAPDSVITEPTPVGAEILNEIQMNGVYTLNTNRIIDGQKEVYVATLEGFTEFNNPDLNLILKINSNNKSNNVYLRLNNIDYQILNCGIGSLISGRFVNARKEENFIKLFLLEKTDLVENDTNKLLSSKGLFDYNEEKELTKFKINAKAIGNTSTSTDLNNILDNGFYVSESGNNKFENNPSGITAFELTITGITPGDKMGYKTQLLKSISDNKYFVRTNTHWNENRWTLWQQLAFDNEVFKRNVRLSDGLPTLESIANLSSGIYSVPGGPVFELPNGYYTVHRLNDRTESGDSTIIVYKAGSGEKFWVSSFNSNNWTGWKEFSQCPYNVGDFYLTSNTRNPALVWHGTSWELVEGRMLIGAKSGQFNLGTTGGNQNINLALGQLPRHRFQVDSFSLGRGTMNITGSFGAPTTEGGNYGNGAFTASYSGGGRSAGAGGGSVSFSFDASKAWTGTTTSASPYTNYVGNGESINIMNPYLAINIWKRIG